MSIIISNISEQYSRTGPQRYEVSLNRFKIVEYDHDSEDGMAVCLLRAADALGELGEQEINSRIERERVKYLAWIESEVRKAAGERA